MGDLNDQAQGAARRTVVAAAVIDERGRLLAARRSGPPALAGKWELPGGKVEPGEGDVDALVRECREELGVAVQVGAQVGADWPLSGDLLMRVWTARVADGVPRPGVAHSELRWLEPGDWLAVDWLLGDIGPIVALNGCINPAS